MGNCPAYPFLSASVVLSNLQANFGDTMRQLSSAWRNLSTQQKNRYRAIAAAAAAQLTSSRTGSSAAAGTNQRSGTGRVYGGGNRQLRCTAVKAR